MTTINLDEILAKAEKLQKEHYADNFVICYANYDEDVFIYSSSYSSPKVVESIQDLQFRANTMLTISGKSVAVHVRIAHTLGIGSSVTANVVTNKKIEI
jgi:hypothetical protein